MVLDASTEDDFVWYDEPFGRVENERQRISGKGGWNDDPSCQGPRVTQSHAVGTARQVLVAARVAVMKLPRFQVHVSMVVPLTTRAD